MSLIKKYKFYLVLTLLALSFLITSIIFFNNYKNQKLENKRINERLETNTKILNYSNENSLQLVDFIKNNIECSNIKTVKSNIYNKNFYSLSFYSSSNKPMIIEGIYSHPTTLKFHAKKYLNVKTFFKKNKINFNYTDELKKTTVLQYIILLKDDNKSCYLTEDIVFMDHFDSENWEIKNVFGRTGFGPGDFSLPYGTEFEDNVFYVTDCTNENISIFSNSGKFLKWFGETKDKKKQLNNPADIKVTEKFIYVVEEYNHRVTVFDKNGNFIKHFGSKKATSGRPDLYTDKFYNPLGLAVSSDTIVIVDYGNNRILAYDLNFNFKWVYYNKSEKKILDAPYYIDYLKEKNAFVISNQFGNNILMLSSEGDFIKTFGREDLAVPYEISVDSVSQNIFVASNRDHSVVIFNHSDNYETSEKIQFPKSFGLPKTVEALNNNRFIVGFVGNGTSYFIDLTKKKSKNFIRTKAFENYSMFCASCHESGRYGSPQRGNFESWENYPKKLNTLLKNTIKGKGSFLKNGGCEDCTKNDIIEIIKIMLPINREY